MKDENENQKTLMVRGAERRAPTPFDFSHMTERVKEDEVTLNQKERR